MKRLFIFVGILLLSGCASMIDSMLNWDQKFYELRGYPLNAVVGLMGLPDNQYQLGDSKVYIWRKK